MKKLLLIFTMGAILFGISAGVSWFLGEHGTKGEDKNPAEGKKITPKGTPAAFLGNDRGKGVVRPSPTPAAENVAHLAATLRQQQDLLKNREQQLLARKKHLDLIFQDIRNEKKGLDEIRQQIGQEMKALDEKMGTLENKAGELNKQKQKIAAQSKEIKKNLLEMDGVETNRIKQMASMYDSMEPDSAAEILQHMADNGRMDTAVKILSTMRERQAARVLAQISDRSMVVQMLERLKGLKKPAGTTQ